MKFCKAVETPSPIRLMIATTAMMNSAITNAYPTTPWPLLDHLESLNEPPRSQGEFGLYAAVA